MALTTEQNLLINNLMYIAPSSGFPISDMSDYEGMTIGEWLASVDMSAIENSTEYDVLVTGREWKNIIEAVKNDSTLSNMVINEVHADNALGGGQGRSAVLTSESTNDAVVVFKGTEGQKEWIDNFKGGSVADTQHQENALEWYQNVYEKYDLGDYEVTVTGHSKGGNKAKYIAILDGTVDNCVSYDGQGFSDKFFEKYADEIAKRQDVIENHNVDYDYVNILLSDVGETTYYNGHDLGKHGFLENHCPNTFFLFGEDGSYSMEVNPDGQPEEMKELDKFINCYLRSMPEDKREDAMALVATIFNSATSFDKDATTTDKINFFLQLAADEKYSDDLAYFVAYVIEYEQANPEFADSISGVLSEFGMSDITQYVDMVDEVLNFEKETWFGTITFDTIVDLLEAGGGLIPDWVWKELSAYLESEFGIELTVGQLKNLLEIVSMVNSDMNKIRIKDNGQDIQIVSVIGMLGQGNFVFESVQVRRGADQIQALEQKVRNFATNVGSYNVQSSNRARRTLVNVQEKLNVLGNKVGQMSTSLQGIASMYEKAENSVADKCRS